MKPSSRTFSAENYPSWQTPVLVIGDLLMLLLFVVVGRLSHGMTDDWLVNVLRIATPFVSGWLIVALLLGLYRSRLLDMPGVFLLRSVIGIVAANGVAFLLRGLLFQDGVTLPFALASIAFSALFVLAWRLLFLFLHRKLFMRHWLPHASTASPSNR